VFVALAMGIGVAGSVYYREQKSVIERRQLDELWAIADAKATQIAAWRRERMADAEVIFTNPSVTASLQRILERKAPAAEIDGMRAWLRVLVKSEYDAAFLLDRQGKVALSAGGHLLPPGAGAAAAMAEAPGATLTDLHRVADSTIHLDLAMPIQPANGAETAGSLVLYINPERFLFPLVRTWPIPSRTAETNLVRRDGDRVTFLSELRHKKITALDLSLPLNTVGLPAAAAAMGSEGSLEGIDYRGVPVLATTRRVPDSPWAIVAKIDAQEVIAPVLRLAWTVGTLVFFLIVAAGACAAWLWRGQQARFYRQRRQAELERKALVHHYGMFSRYSNEVLALVNDRGGILEFNERAAEVYGYSPEEFSRIQVRDLWPPEERRQFDALWGRVGEEESGLIFETRHQRKNGTVFPVEISARIVDVDGVPFRPCVIRDITHRKELERHISEARERESLLALAAGVAHNFNNDMMAVLGNASLLEAAGPLPPEALAQIEGVVSGAQHAAALTSKLLAYAGGGRFVWRPIDLPGEARQAVERVRETAPEGVRIDLEIGENLPPVKADRAQIDLLLTNLMQNGAEAIGEEGGAVRLSVAAIDIDAATAARDYPEMGPGAHVRLTVSDTGAGMDEDTKSRIFDPFFTTKFLGRGLGLAAVQGIVRGHNGAIRVESAPGKGSVFAVVLPVG
jgi:PAS domain S-box-containing protein